MHCEGDALALLISLSKILPLDGDALIRALYAWLLGTFAHRLANPDLIIGNSGDFIPLVLEEQTQGCLFPLYPPQARPLQRGTVSSFTVLRAEACSTAAATGPALGPQ